MTGEVHITIRASDLSKPQLDALVGNLGRVQRAGDSTRGSFERFGAGADRTFGFIERGMGVMTRLDLVQITLQQSAERVTAAQEKYREAVAEAGSGSREAAEAQRQLTAAMADQEKAQLRAHLSYVLVTGELISMAAQIPRAIAALSAMRAAMMGSAVAAGVLQVAMNPLAAVAIVAGVAAVASAISATGEAAQTATPSVAGYTAELNRMRRAASEAAVAELGDARARVRADADERTRRAALEQTIASGNREAITEARNTAQEELAIRENLLSRLASLSAVEQQQRIAELEQYAKALREAEAEGLAGQLHLIPRGVERFPEFDGIARANLGSYVANLQQIEQVLDTLRTSSPEGVEEEILRLRDALEAYDAALEDVSADEFRRAQEEQREAAEAMREAAAAAQRAWEESLQATNSALQATGLNLGRFGREALQYVSALSAEMAHLAGEAAKAQAQEDALAQSMLRSAIPALREQVTVTRDKGETTDQFRARLIQMGFTEEEVARYVDDTTESLNLQRAATAEMNQAARGFGYAQGVGMHLAYSARSAADGQSAESFLRTDPNVDVTGLRPGDAMPGGRGFEAQPYDDRRGSRIVLGTGGVTINVHLAPGEGSAADVERGVLNAIDVARRRQAAVMNW